MYADAVNRKQLGPDSFQHFFKRGAWSDVLASPLRTLAIRRRQCGPIDLSVRREWQGIEQHILEHSIDPTKGKGFVAQVFTGAEGKYVPLKETIESFKKISEGEYDHFPEQAFFMCGGLDDVDKKWEEIQKGL